MKSTWPMPAPRVGDPTPPIFHLLALGVGVGGVVFIYIIIYTVSENPACQLLIVVALVKLTCESKHSQHGCLNQTTVANQVWTRFALITQPTWEIAMCAQLMVSQNIHKLRREVR